MPGQIKCTHCGQVYGLTDEQVPLYAGKTITCTQCRKPFTVPAADGSTPLPPPPYSAQYDDQSSPKTTSGMAVASIVCGALGFVIPLIPSLLGIIFGIIGLKKTKDPKVGGKSLSIAGICLGSASMVVVFCMFSYMFSSLVPSLNRARETANRVKCMANLKSIGQAMLLYSNDNGGLYPAGLENLILAQDISSEVFVCPSSDDEAADGATPQTQAQNLGAGGHLSYVYVYSGKNVRGADLTANHVVVYEPIDNHDDGGSNFLFGDGHVEFFPRADAEKMIVQLNSGQNPPSRR